MTRFAARERPVSVFERAIREQVLVLDGATGTELERHGVPTPAPLWSAAAIRSHPDVLRGIHRAYIDAGADIITANTFRTNPRACRAAGDEFDFAALTAEAVRIAREAIVDAGNDRRVWIAGSVSPVEDCYAPELAPDEAALRDEHARMCAALANAGVDVIWIETINTVREAAAAAEAAALTGLPFVVSFVTREDGSLLSGEPLFAAVDAVAPIAPAAIGLNCIPPAGLTRNLGGMDVPPVKTRTLGGTGVSAVCHCSLNSASPTTLPLVAYAHIGYAHPLPGWSYTADDDVDGYAREAEMWLKSGARIVGGCCGTNPAHISALRALVDEV